MGFSGKQVLVAENHMANQFVIKQLLEKVNIASAFAKKLLKCTEANTKTGIWSLMDYKMFVIDGCQAAGGIRQFEQDNGRGEAPD